jgi:hypothetical protein
MKKRATIITAVLLCISLTACGNQPDRPANMIETETTAVTTETVTETETAAAVDPRIGDIAGVWFEDGEKALDPRTLTVSRDGTFVLEYKGGGAKNGKVVVETEAHPDGTETVWYSFYEEDDALWTGFQRTPEQPQEDLYSGQDGELHFIRAESINRPAETTAVTGSETVTTTAAASTAATTAKAAATTAATTAIKDKYGNTPNAYGFYPEMEVPRTSVSVKQFDGTWYDADDPVRSIQFYNCDYLRGSFTLQNADGSLTDGIMQLEYKLRDDGIETGYYNLYDKSGKYLFGVGTNTDIPFYQFSSADNKYHFTRQKPGGDVHTGDDFLGNWSVGRHYITIDKFGAAYQVYVKQAISAAESTVWTYDCEYNGEYLDSTNGRCVSAKCDEDGNASSEVLYTNGCAHFRLNENGQLIWEDLREHCCDDEVFIKIS